MLSRKVDANCFINAAISSHLEAWKQARNSENYIVLMESPLPEAKLRSEAAYASNYNFGTGRSQLKQDVKLNVAEISKALSLVEINFPKFDKNKHNNKDLAFLQFDELKTEIAERIAYVFSEFIDSESLFSTFVQRAEYMNYLFGYAAAIDDQQSYLPDVIHFCDIGFEDHTNVNDIGKFVVFDTVKGDYIYSRLKQVKDEDANILLSQEDDSYITSSGWNKEALIHMVCSIFSNNKDAMDLLKELKPERFDSTDVEQHGRYETWEDITLLSTHKGEMWCRINLNNVNIAKIYQLFDNTLYEVYVFLNQYSGHERSMLSSVQDILFYKEHKGKAQDDFINIINDFSIDGTKYIHDITGAGRMLADHSLRYDIKRNASEDKLFFSGLNYWRAGNTASLGRALDIRVIAGNAIINDNLEPVVMQQKLDVSDTLLSLQQESNEHNKNFQHYRANTQLSNRPTKDEVQFVNAEAYTQRNSDIPIKLKAYSKVLTNAFKKIISEKFISHNLEKSCECFIESLIEEFSDYDLTKEQLLTVLRVVSSLKISPVLSDREAIGQALSVAGTASARKRLTKMLLMTYGFSSIQIRSIMEFDEYGKDAETVAVENDMFERTAEVVFGISQDHILHLNGHYYKLDRKFTGIQNGEDPVIAFNFARNCLINTQQHLEAVERNVFYKRYVKDFRRLQALFERELKTLGQNLDEARNRMQQGGQSSGQPQLTPEQQHKFYQDEVKLKVKLRNTEIRNQQARQMALQKQDFNQTLQRQKAEFEMEEDKRKNDAEIDAMLAKKSVEMV